MSEQPENTHTQEEQPEGTAPSGAGNQSPLAQPAGIFKSNWKFVAGFLGWYLVMALAFWFAFGNTLNPSGLINGLCIFPAQILALIFLFLIKKMRLIGWGMLSAIGANLLISLILGLIGNAVCFIPFFISI